VPAVVLPKLPKMSKTNNKHNERDNFHIHGGIVLSLCVPDVARWRLQQMVLQGMWPMCVHSNHHCRSGCPELLPSCLYNAAKCWLQAVVLQRLRSLYHDDNKCKLNIHPHHIDRSTHHNNFSKAVLCVNMSVNAKWRLWEVVLRRLCPLWSDDNSCEGQYNHYSWVHHSHLLDDAWWRLQPVVLQRLRWLHNDDEHHHLHKQKFNNHNHNNFDIDVNHSCVQLNHLPNLGRWGLWLVVLPWLRALHTDNDNDNIGHLYYHRNAVFPRCLFVRTRRRLWQVVLQKLHSLHHHYILNKCKHDHREYIDDNILNEHYQAMLCKSLPNTPRRRVRAVVL